MRDQLFSFQILTFALFAFESCLTGNCTLADTVDFEDVSLPASGYYKGLDGAGGFTSRGVFFPNTYTDWGGGYTSWENWACSRTTDTTTGTSANEFSAITGQGQGGSAQYAVGFPSFTTGVSNFSLPYPTSLQDAYFTNTTYAYLTMLNGNAFAKKFGGESGNYPDWFLLTITGKNAEGESLGSLDFFLADYRDPEPNNHYIINQWTGVELSSLGSNVKTLEFAMSSSDTGIFGMNTPGYFAMDTFSTATGPSWTGSQTGSWSNTGNWSSGNVPSSGDDILFKDNNNLAINLDGNRSIRNIAFDTASAGSFSLNNNTLTLDAGGSITVTGAVAASQTFNCNLALAGNGFLVNDSIASGQKLIINGDINSEATGGVQNLILGGAGNGMIGGTVGNGATGGTLGLVKQGEGVWTLGNNAIYSGETTIDGGLLQLNGAVSNLHAIGGQGDLGVGDGIQTATLTADSIAVDTLTVAAGAKIVINPMAGGPLTGENALTAVPEPSTGILVIITVLGLLIWKARQKIGSL